MFLKKIKRKIRVLRHKITSEDYNYWLRKQGISVGSHTYFFSPSTTVIDTQRPWLIEIGDYCKITQGVIILSHDYSRSVLRRVYGEVIGEAKKTKIGDNVFVGINSIILMGSTIGNNVIIGAGSVVHGNIPDNVVVAGNPARVISTLEEYYQKRKMCYKDEALESVRLYQEKFHRHPTEKEMGAFFPLFATRTEGYLAEKQIFTNLSGDDEREIVENFFCSTPDFDSYDAFLQEATKKK